MQAATEQNKHKVFVTGASGKLGQALCQDLMKSGVFEVVGSVPPQEVKEKCSKLEQCGCKVCECDAAKTESVVKVLRETKPMQMAIIGTAESHQAEHLKSYIDAAKEAGVEYVLLFSSAGADKDVTIWGKQFHEIEDYLKRSVKNWTIVRSMFHAENFLLYAKEIKEHNTLTMPTNDYFAPVSVLDVACAATHILKDCQKHHGKTYDITGVKAKHGTGFAKAASKALGRKIEFKKISMEDAHKLLIEHGMKHDKADFLISFYKAVDENKLNFVSPDCRTLTGTDPMSMRQVFEHYGDILGKKKEE
ncbi:hypothetical protein SmJEL517_g01057 [Synchytrium microbalum]|uniref:NmrA-like domain-containing protein n=1 Tax=Synchytrium microbalum TaxID=1806994 RepID=A0A507CGJ0_9FUNG|nr:uncharacterized protein SmJEL517_g01057 [Synchytrium microbalum]TPX37156.1 hypothetical protein SmJEL517_g01057 [Synchytrium microbalum]